jgi:TolB-like protein/AraC-like DNA-binding protein
MTTGATHNEQDFISRLKEIVESNLQNEQFGVTELVREIRMSRSFVHRYIKKHTNQTVSQFIRNARLEKAMEMLLNSDEPASEIAFRVGFGSPAYFNHCFHEHFGFPPGEARKRSLDITESDIAAKSTQPKSGTYPKSGIITNNRPEKKRLVAYYTVAAIIALAIISFMGYNLIFTPKQSPKEPVATDQSIIVLPFKNLSRNPDIQYFADGIAEDILNNLYHIKTLRVVSRTSAEQYRESTLPVKEIARLMNVGFVLEGSVRMHENKIRISIQFIDAINDNHLWSDNFDRELTDILDIQDDVAFQVAQKLGTVLSENEIGEIEKKGTQNPEAYNYYLRARFLLHKANSANRADFDKTGALNCIQYYEKAIAADSTFADAWAGLANAWFNLSAWFFLPASEGFPKARMYSMKAIEYDPECAEAYAVLGAFLTWGQGNFTDGGKELKKSVELNPNFSTARQWYAQYLMITGPIEEARLQINLVLELEPYFWVVQTLSAWIWYFQENYERSVKECLAARELNPNFNDNNWLLVLNYARLGEGEKMIQELETIIKNFSDTEKYQVELNAAYAESGISGVFAWLIDVNNHRPIPVQGMNGHPFYSAWWHAILGNCDDAVYWLERTMEDIRPLWHYSNLIATNPDFDILRNDRRFLQIIEKKELTSYHKRMPKK